MSLKKVISHQTKLSLAHIFTSLLHQRFISVKGKTSECERTLKGTARIYRQWCEKRKTNKKIQWAAGLQAEMHCWWERSEENGRTSSKWKAVYSNSNNLSLQLWWAEGHTVSEGTTCQFRLQNLMWILTEALDLHAI